jgi:4-diphosphocytidyl-2-C-methyl-D-erythritol kinase
VSVAEAYAKINLALVVGPKRPDGKHEVATVLQQIELSDEISLEPGPDLEISGFPGDTLVRDALLALAGAAGVDPQWSVRIEKRIPVASGLGGGSSDAAAALRLANELLSEPLANEQLHAIAAQIGADVPFFLAEGPQLGTKDGSELEPLHLSDDYVVLLVLSAEARKQSTAAVYEAFEGAEGFDDRRSALRAAIAAGDLAALPANDLTSSPIAEELRGLGAFRADVTGAGPVVYGLFAEKEQAEAARPMLELRGQTWLTAPRW